MNDAFITPIKPHWPLSLTAGTTRTAHPHADKGFNLAQHIDCDRDAVAYRRSAWLAALNMCDVTPMWLTQTHSAKVVDDTNYRYGCEADAAISRDGAMMPVVLTADCVPILLAQADGHEVAAIHAGWQGLYCNIIGETIRLMHTNAVDIRAWIGPCIRQRHYEVDDAFRARFISLEPDYHAYFTVGRTGHWFADLAALTKHQLRKAGIADQYIYDSEICTFADERFFSYRRDKSLSGRIATFILPNKLNQ